MDIWRRYGQALVVLLLLALLPNSLVDAQTPKPVVAFEADKYQVGPNQPVTLNWSMQNIDEASLVWPGGQPETLYGPGARTVSFPSAGDYTFTLRALYDGGEKQVSIIFHVAEQQQQPRPVCTPPPCPAGGKLRCPEGKQCPGGCGVVCVSPTKTWWVRGNVTDSVVGAPLGNVTISCQGGSVAASTKSSAYGTFELTWNANPEAKPDGRCTAQIDGFNISEVALTQPGADSSYQLQFSLQPDIPQGNGEWAINYVAAKKAAELGQPLGAMQQIATCARKFQNGGMLWRSGDKRSAIVPLIGPTSRFYLADDTWDQHSAPPCPQPTAPGLYLPDKGLGWSWCQNEGVRQELGYATEPQELCDGAQFGRMQDFQNGRLVWIQKWNKVIYLRWNGGFWYGFDFSP